MSCETDSVEKDIWVHEIRWRDSCWPAYQLKLSYDDHDWSDRWSGFQCRANKDRLNVAMDFVCNGLSVAWRVLHGRLLNFTACKLEKQRISYRDWLVNIFKEVNPSLYIKGNFLLWQNTCQMVKPKVTSREQTFRWSAILGFSLGDFGVRDKKGFLSRVYLY
jgi:hypothetical protein